MGRFIDNTSNDAKSKKILRGAFMMVKSTDQTLIKSYLRVLLGFKAEIEWVSADDLYLDLLIVDKDSRNSATVNSLLIDQPSLAILYVSRTDMSSGWVKDNEIILPLRKLDDLHEWLIQSIAKLSTDSVTMTSTHLEEAYKSDNTQAEEASFIDSPQMTTTNDIVSEYQGIIDFIKHLQQRPTGLHQIVSNHQAIAIVEPSRARIWIDENKAGMSPAISLDWQLHLYHDSKPSNHEAKDLKQWLSQCNGLHLLFPLINHSSAYRLQDWIKPMTIVIDDAIGNATIFQQLAGEERRELLQVMTALESAACNIEQLASLTQLPVSSLKKIISKLLFSGSLQAASYDQLEVTVSHSIDDPAFINEGNQETISEETAVNNQLDETYKPTAKRVKQSAFEALLERRARGEIAVNISSSAEIVLDNTTGGVSRSEQPKAQQEVDPQDKRGFLSRLRQKLGL